MSLATRCPACGTVFRVVQDQLKVSEGWVRCGRCSEVFNAVESLFDLEQDAPPPWQGVGAPAAAPPLPPVPPDDRSIDDGSGAARSSAQAPEPDGHAAAAPAFPNADPADDDVPGRHADDVSEPAPMQPPWPAARQAMTPESDVEPAPSPAFAHEPAVRPAAESAGFERHEPSLQDDPADMAPPPRFIAQAERTRKGSSTAARLTMAAAAGVLAVLALGQAAYGGRDLIAAHWPPARAALDPMCSLLACNIEPLRRIQRLTVDGSGLAKLETGSLYRLTLLLRNRDAVELRVPSFDLTLTDAQGLVVARKVLDAAALGASQPAIGPGAELPLQAVLEAGNRRVVGYTVDIFYP